MHVLITPAWLHFEVPGTHSVSLLDAPDAGGSSRGGGQSLGQVQSPCTPPEVANAQVSAFKWRMREWGGEREREEGEGTSSLMLQASWPWTQAQLSFSGLGQSCTKLLVSVSTSVM